MKLSEHFTLEELIRSATANKYHIDNTPDQSSIANLNKLCDTILEPIRIAYGKPMYVSSGFRCKKLNSLVGGASTSQHQYGEAVDIQLRSKKENLELFLLIVRMILEKKITVGQLLWENGGQWIHISLPNTKHKNQILL